MILAAVEKWIHDEKSSFLIEAVGHPGSTLADITAALDRFEQLKIDDQALSRATRIGLRVGAGAAPADRRQPTSSTSRGRT